MPQEVPPTIDPMATQMARLLLESDLDELRETVKRWVATSSTQQQRRVFESFGGRMLELKEALATAPVQPTHGELETALTLMLRLAAQQQGGAPPGR